MRLDGRVFVGDADALEVRAWKETSRNRQTISGVATAGYAGLDTATG